MEWKKEYGIGVNSIDSQHMGLIDCVNQYKSEISKNGFNKENINRTIKYLVNYASFHFEDEEEFMTSIQYNELEEHKKIHAGIILKLRNMIISIRDGKTITDIEFYYFLMSWLNDHILIQDMKIRKFYKYNNVVIKQPHFESITKTLELTLMFPIAKKH